MTDMITAPVAPRKGKRIFWLGMHKVLMQTELPRLRMLGYEVFNPPYLSDIDDQSANREWAPPLDTTLPLEVFKKLAATQFFYKPIPQDVAELLNIYFDAVIITINPDWLLEFLKVYHGPLIYRVYGQPYSLSLDLLNSGAIRLISEREAFWFSPHTDKTLTIEDPWLLNNIRIIPYCLTDDVVAMKDNWKFDEERMEIGMLCPRAADIPYYRNSYKYLKSYFPSKNYKIFGGQIVQMKDPQVVGTLTRDQLLMRFCALRGFIYHYTESTVCYLPPIEFMTMGGPVIFEKGSLLERFFKDGDRAPGCAHDDFTLRNRASQVEKGDQVLIEEIIASQKQVRQLYLPDYVWPIFDRAMQEMLDGDVLAPASKFLRVITPKPAELPQLRPTSVEQITTQPQAQAQEIVLAFHKFGTLIHKRGGEYYCTEGIARVVRLGVQALTKHGYRVVVTAYKKDVANIHGFLTGTVSEQNRLQILVIDGTWHKTHLHRLKNALLVLVPKRKELKLLREHMKERIIHILAQPLKMVLTPSNLAILIFLYPIIFVLNLTRIFSNLLRPLVRKILDTVSHPSTDYIKQLENEQAIKTIWVPHYYLFPEVVATKTKKIVLYLPDYLPYFYEGNVEMGSTAKNKRIGKVICNRADLIFTNSHFTQNYLPKTALMVDPEKIRYIPLPNLNFMGHNHIGKKGKKSAESLPKYYVFYPTRERPSKRLRDFVDTVAAVNKHLNDSGRNERLYGIITTVPSKQLFINNPLVQDQIKVMENLSDSQLQTVYSKATALLLTSEMEGNFPPQINEALNFHVPVIATRIPLIIDELGKYSNNLSLVNVGDVDGFASAVLSVMGDRDAAIIRQDPARTFVAKYYSYKNFAAGICCVFDEVVSGVKTH